MRKFPWLKIFLIALLPVVALLVLSFFSVRKMPPERESAKKVLIDGREFKVELALDSAQQQLGLGERDNLCSDCGMLFIFSQKSEHSFWMKDMRFPLDIIWIDGDKIAYIARNVPPDSRDTITPPLAADKVLEINGGLCDKYQIKEGDMAAF